jgi:hypothetical protein
VKTVSALAQNPSLRALLFSLQALISQRSIAIMSLKAIVKSVISGDSLVLRGRAGPQGQPPKERFVRTLVAPMPL